MEPGNVLIYRDEKFGHHRYWQVEGVFLGGENQESLIELRSLSESTGSASTTTQSLETLFVPEVLTRHLEVRDSIANVFQEAGK